MKRLVVAALAATLVASSGTGAATAAEVTATPNAVANTPSSPAASTPSSPAANAARKTPGAAATLRAAATPDQALLRALIRQGADVNATSQTGETPLQAAAEAGIATNVALLLGAGARIDELGARGITALGWAARTGRLEAARALLDAGADVDLAESVDRTPIVLATAREHQALVELLIERGSKVFEKPPLAGAALMALAQTTSVELAGTLAPRIGPMIAGAAGLRDAAAAAVAASTVQVSQVLLLRFGRGVQSKEFLTALLIAAVRRGRHDVAAAAIGAGASVNGRPGTKMTPIGLAVEMGDSSLVRLLADAGADVHAPDVNQKKFAELAGSDLTERKEAERLAALGQIDRLDDNGVTLLFLASQRGNFLTVKQLLERGANPSTTVRRWSGDEGWTPLMTAAAGNQIAIVKLLLSGGAPVDQRNSAGRTALHFAALYGRSAVVDLLLESGADPRARDSVGQTAMGLANESGDSATILRIGVAVRTESEAAGGAAAGGAAADAAPATEAP